MLNVKCQVSSVKCQVSSVKCQMSNVKCQLANENQMSNANANVRSNRYLLWDLSTSCEIPTMLYNNQSVQIGLAHRLYTDVQYFLFRNSERSNQSTAKTKISCSSSSSSSFRQSKYFQGSPYSSGPPSPLKSEAGFFLLKSAHFLKTNDPKIFKGANNFSAI